MSLDRGDQSAGREWIAFQGQPIIFVFHSTVTVASIRLWLPS
ncbi:MULTISPECIES: hypothetical protein [Streptomyces]|nr:hypothetical protein [Streptomyces tricolor]